MSAIWYVLRDGNCTGPFTAAEVKAQLRDGLIRPMDDLGTGNGEWQNARLWDELTSLPQQSAPSPENQPGLPEDSVKYPAPPPLPATSKATDSSSVLMNWGKLMLAFFFWSLIAAYFDLPFFGKNQKQPNYFPKNTPAQQQKSKTVTP